MRDRPRRGSPRRTTVQSQGPPPRTPTAHPSPRGHGPSTSPPHRTPGPHAQRYARSPDRSPPGNKPRDRRTAHRTFAATHPNAPRHAQPSHSQHHAHHKPRPSPRVSAHAESPLHQTYPQRRPAPLPPRCFTFLLFFAFFLTFVLGQPVTPIFVVWLITAPFWAVRVVGIVSFCAHMLFFAFTGMSVARTECGPCGKTVTNELIGASGTLLNVLVVMPCLMFVLPSR